MFLNDPELLWADMQINYIVAPTQEELVKLLKRVDEFKMQDFKPKDYSILIFEFTTELKARNEDLPVANKRTDPQLATIFLAGMHPNLFDSASTVILRCKWLTFILRLWILHPSFLTAIIIYVRDVLAQGSVGFISYRRMLIPLSPTLVD